MIPDSARASSNMRGRPRKSSSRNKSTATNSAAHHPVAPASPAAFWTICNTQGSDLTEQRSSRIKASAPSSQPTGPQPTRSFGVSRSIRMSKIGKKIWHRCRMSLRLMCISSVSSPKALMPCLRD